MAEEINNLDGVAIVGRRVPQLADSQKYPYVGNSTVKRIITDGETPQSIPAHLEPITDEKLSRFKELLCRTHQWNNSNWFNDKQAVVHSC